MNSYKTMRMLGTEVVHAVSSYATMRIPGDLLSRVHFVDLSPETVDAEQMLKGHPSEASLSEPVQATLLVVSRSPHTQNP